ncbi:unannotated protein [freshwater metagenome]|uniref:Unannotated protein n=1 Tax=freshwater metagenome TaxID=449393 RepID=A0A6J6G8U3_9ZZZZ
MRIAASSARPSCWNDSAWSSATPPIVAVTPDGRSTESRASFTAAVAAVRSSLDGVTATVDERTPRSVVRVAAVFSIEMVATDDSATSSPRGDAMVKALSSSTVVGAFDAMTMTLIVTSSITIWVTADGLMMLDSVLLIPVSVRNSRAAAARSMSIEMNSSTSERELSTSSAAPEFVIASKILVVTSLRVSSDGALIVTSILVEPNAAPPPPAREIVPLDGMDSSWRVTSACTASASTSGESEIVTWYVMSPEPPNRAARRLPPPTVVWTLSIPSIARRSFSASSAMATLPSRVSPAGTVCRRVTVV